MKLTTTVLAASAAVPLTTAVVGATERGWCANYSNRPSGAVACRKGAGA